MELARLGKKGQVTIPRPVLRRLGPGGEIPLTIETTANGAIVRSKQPPDTDTRATDEIRIFLDANVLSSAVCQDHSDLLVLSYLGNAGAVELLSPAFAIGEGRRSVALLKCSDRMAAHQRLTAGVFLTPPPASEHLAIAYQAGPPPKDAPTLAVALATPADLLVTGDRTNFCPLFGHPIDNLTVQPATDALSVIS